VLYELDCLNGSFFVEFGATDGLTINNTTALEKHHEWHGILAEPNPIWHEKLGQNRAAAIEVAVSIAARALEILAYRSSAPFRSLAGLNEAEGNVSHSAAVANAWF